MSPETLSVQCDPGYRMIGSPSISCSENKSWSPKVPKCEREVPGDREILLAGQNLLQCLPSAWDSKTALEIQKLSLEIGKLEQERDKGVNIYLEDIYICSWASLSQPHPSSAGLWTGSHSVQSQRPEPACSSPPAENPTSQVLGPNQAKATGKASALVLPHTCLSNSLLCPTQLVTETQPRPRPELTLAQRLTKACFSPLVAADASECWTASLLPHAMSPKWQSAPAVLHLCGGLLLLLLLLNTPPVRSDCSPPPDMPNATPVLKGVTTFPVDKTVYYSCNQGYLRIPGTTHTIQCLRDNTWLKIDPNFCGRSCPSIRKLVYATLKKIYIPLSYYPVGTVVGFDCAPGYERIPSKSAEVTCLANYTWSNPDVFCKKKPCAHPGELKNGYINITDGLLLASRIVFSCNLGKYNHHHRHNSCFNTDRSCFYYKAPNNSEIHLIKSSRAAAKESPVSGTTQKPPISNALPANTSPAAQSPTMKNASAAQATPSTQSASTVKASFTQRLPTTQRSTGIHVPGTKGHQTTRTSAPLTTTRGVAVPRATTRFHTTSTAKGRGTLSSSGQ
ncbi:PREDICTED: complement decay-accelerating factor [Elephantulus edwardii]|uniref:complement decay-accelerating factor n=1 Tax=Elephantulus edwardii TaxID=28737 RepID=UPI0003F0E5D5|nr:PREDICTED: complement decay-accelerating factor [Elephantulus edwardii]